MRHKGMLIVVVAGLVLAALAQYLLSSSVAATTVYAQYVFAPFQLLRNSLFGWCPISLGDLLYIGAAVFAIALVVKGVRKLVKRQLTKRDVLLTLLRIGLAAGVCYIWFLIGWGGNYHKPSLSEYWSLNEDSAVLDDSTLIDFDKYLIARLNEYAPKAVFRDFETMESKSREYYRSFAPTIDKSRGVAIKPSLFGNLLEYSGVQGYYNPFTGEGQANSNLPGFLQPFLICHEMAHQTGIAAEDDANLLSFIVCTNSRDPAFVYSSYFNVWLYVNGELRSRDSSLAFKLRDGLNPITWKHIYTLRELRKKYKSPVSRWSSYFYDNFLKLNRQKKGMESYDDVVYSAWAWEQRRLKGENTVRSVP